MDMASSGIVARLERSVLIASHINNGWVPYQQVEIDHTCNNRACFNPITCALLHIENLWLATRHSQETD
jgi:hypothetical protein